MNSFGLKNTCGTWLQIEVAGKSVTLLPGKIVGVFTSQDLSPDIRRKVQRGDLAVIEHAPAKGAQAEYLVLDDIIEADNEKKHSPSESEIQTLSKTENNVEPTQGAKTGRRARRQS